MRKEKGEKISFQFGVTFRRFCEEKGRKNGVKFYIILKKGNKSRAYYNLLGSDINLSSIPQNFQLSPSGRGEDSPEKISEKGA